MKADGKAAIITGASGKLGSQLAVRLGKMGFYCHCHYNSNAAAAQLAVDQIISAGGKARLIQADLSCPKGIDVLTDSFDLEPQAVVLVNSASYFYRTAAADCEHQKISRLMQLNVNVPIMLSMEFAKRIKAQTAKIINITDVAGQLVWAEYSAYCASKAALISITKGLAKELAPRILVNAISPGVIDWPQDFDTDEAARQIAKVPLKRAAKYEEVADTLEFIINNDYLTGQIISVDGGRSLA